MAPPALPAARRRHLWLAHTLRPTSLPPPGRCRRPFPLSHRHLFAPPEPPSHPPPPPLWAPRGHPNVLALCGVAGRRGLRLRHRWPLGSRARPCRRLWLACEWRYARQNDASPPCLFSTLLRPFHSSRTARVSTRGHRRTGPATCLRPRTHPRPTSAGVRSAAASRICRQWPPSCPCL